MHKYEELLTTIYNGREDLLPKRILALDPGNTTGYCIFIDGKFAEDGQIKTIIEKGGENGASCIIYWNEIVDLLGSQPWDAVVIENYRIYSDKLERHSFSEVPTLRLIGGIDMWCSQRNIPTFYQMATLAKGFVNDKKMEAWGLKRKHAARHGGDAIRHAIYFLFISNLKREFLKEKSK